MKDRPLMKDHFCSNMFLHVYTFVPPMNAHLSYKITFCVTMGWSLVTDFIVPVVDVHYYVHPCLVGCLVIHVRYTVHESTICTINHLN